MDLLEAERRLAEEVSWLDQAVQTGRPIAIALGQSNVKKWEEVVRQKRLESEGGWTP